MIKYIITFTVHKLLKGKDCGCWFFFFYVVCNPWMKMLKKNWISCIKLIQLKICTIIYQIGEKLFIIIIIIILVVHKKSYVFY